MLARLLRVGGRLRRSSVDFDAKHLIILPASALITRLIMEDHYKRMGHSGIAHTVNWSSIVNWWP